MNAPIDFSGDPSVSARITVSMADTSSLAARLDDVAQALATIRPNLLSSLAAFDALPLVVRKLEALLPDVAALEERVRELERDAVSADRFRGVLQARLRRQSDGR